MSRLSRSPVQLEPQPRLPTGQAGQLQAVVQPAAAAGDQLPPRSCRLLSVPRPEPRPQPAQAEGEEAGGAPVQGHLLHPTLPQLPHGPGHRQYLPLQRHQE